MKSFVQGLIQDFPNLALVIQLSMIVIVTAVCLIILSIILIIIHRYIKYRIERREKKLTPKIDQMIYEYIYMDSLSEHERKYGDKEEIVDNLSSLIRRRRNKQLFIDRLIGLKRTIGGDVNEEIKELIFDLNLEKFLLRKIRNFRRHRKVKGLSELAALDMPVADVHIIPLTHSRSRPVRVMARNAYVKLSKNNPFNFFDSNKEELLVWEQIELFNIITTSEHLAIPNFSSWISHSKNKSIIKFCLELVAFYDQLESLPSVMKLLDHEDTEIRIAAIKCLGKMKVKEAEPKLVDIYIEQPRESQLEILESIAQIRTGRYIDFLINEFHHGSEFSIRQKAAKAIVNNSRHEEEIIDELLFQPTKEQEVMLQHYLNPLTKSA